MTPNEYQEASTRTLMSNEEQASKLNRALNLRPELAQIIVAGLKLSSESGEFNDAIVKHICYGQPLDIHNLEEECGDLFWYLSMIITTLGGDIESVMEANVNKLKIRYPERFSEKDAIERKDKI